MTVLIGGSSASAFTQERIYRCGNEYVKEASNGDEDSGRCKLISGDNVMTNTPAGGAATKKHAKAAKKVRDIEIGMLRFEVVDSNWGRPERIHKTTTASGTDEQWVYPRGYLYFHHGVLTAIQH